jgi:SAM-dependent methyltransferase
MSTTPDPSAKERVIAYYDQEADRYIDLYRGDRMEREVYPANDIRLEIIVARLRELGVRTVLDIGCGSGGPLTRFLDEGFDARGIDFSEGMVTAARDVLSAAGHDPSRASHGDVERVETLPGGRFDAIVATGVFPHNLDDRAAYASLRERLAPEGVAFVEYRNALMSLFSLNSYSEPFFWHDLIRGDELTGPLHEATRAYLAEKLGAPVESVGRPREIEYGDILARFHNPLTLGDEVAAHGFALDRIHWYHFHAAPPALEHEHRVAFWERSLALEDPADWRGMFLASAFVSELRRG